MKAEMILKSHTVKAYQTQASMALDAAMFRMEESRKYPHNSLDRIGWRQAADTQFDLALKNLNHALGWSKLA